ncbi:MAG: 3-hydroxyacyl-ACP dehydratase FabZ [Bdellovibrionales bacterium]|nr:3-hydroxyacyl-ACP dehydratase FabZ [Bdellovibrionales bacterium]
MKLMPHRFPFLLVDKVVEREDGPDSKFRTGNKITALKNVTFNEPFFPGHFPEMPIMPGVLQIEALAQAACLAYLRKGDPEFDFFIAAVQEAKFRRPVVPGDQLMLHVEIVKDRGSMLQVNAEARVDGQTAAECMILAKVFPKTKRDQA